MFTKFPSKLSAPFGLLNDEAKLSFRSQPSGISKLANTRRIPETDVYWNQYVELFDSPSDVFSLISPHDIRRALLEAPENVATLLKVICMRLFNLVSDHTFPASNNASVTSFASSFIKSAGSTLSASSERNATKEVLNCLRVLQRILPVVFELEGEQGSSRFELEVLWKREEIVEQEAGRRDGVKEKPQFVIEDDDEEDEEGNAVGGSSSAQTEAPSSLAQAQKPKEKKTHPSLAERLFSCLVDLLFCCGFTLPAKIQKDHYKINYVIWEKGVGSTVDPGPSQAYDTNKTEVLRLLLVLLSKQIYVPPHALLSKPSLYTLHFVQNTPRRDVLTVLCSLLNTCMNAHHHHDASASTLTNLSGMATKLPYNHLMFKGEDPRANLVGMAFQVLCVLLDFQSGSARDVLHEDGHGTPTAQTNAFRYFLVKLHRTQDFEFIIDGLLGILEQQMGSMNNLLPGSRKAVPYILETYIFFWKMIDLNKKFRAYLLESDKSIDIMAYLLCYCLEIKDKPQQHGLCRALSYIVQTLSAERAFGMKMSSPVKAQLPAKWHPVGTAGDFMINAIYSIVATTSGALNSLYPALIIALSNCAPYFKNLSVTASTRLIQLFKSFSSSLFLLSDEGHPRLLYFMLEVFNNVILHNLSENPNLIHAILSAHKTFEDLGTFTLARGLRDVRRAQLAKEEQARRAEGNGKGKERSDLAAAEEGRAGSDEKVRLLEHEREEREALSVPRDTASYDRPGSSEMARTGREERQQDPESESPSATTTEPLTSPTSAEPPARVASPSEKARGKMKEQRRSMSMDQSLERVAAAGIGRNGFVPTQEWVTSWQQGLPLDPIMLLISELFPKVQEMQSSRSKPVTTGAIMDFLRSVNLKDVLPPAPPLNPRRFMWSDASIIWLTSLVWGEIYVRGMTPLGVWNATNVRLFYVKHHAQTSQPRQITEAVSNVVGGLLGRTDSSGSLRSRSNA